MSDSHFVFGLRLNGHGGASALHESSGEADGARWFHIDYSSQSAQDWLAQQGLNANIVDSLTRADTRPRALTTDDGILIVLRGINFNPGAEPEDMVSLRMWIEPNRLISVRQRRLQSLQDIRATLESGNGPTSVPDVVTAVIERLADRISDFVESIDASIYEYEDTLATVQPNAARREINALRRKAAVMRRFLAPQRDALDNLYRHSRGILNDQQTYSVREQADRITRSVEDLDLIRERALVIQEELINRLAQEQNARLYVLSVVAAIFLPVTFITGLLGMNVGGLPGTEYRHAFWIVCGSMLVLALAVALLFRLKRWF